MPKALLQDIVRHCDRTLKIDEIADYDGAVNGLQVENNGQVSRITVVFDAYLTTGGKDIIARAALSVVHYSPVF